MRYLFSYPSFILLPCFSPLLFSSEEAFQTPSTYVPDKTSSRILAPARQLHKLSDMPLCWTLTRFITYNYDPVQSLLLLRASSSSRLHVSLTRSWLAFRDSEVNFDYDLAAALFLTCTHLRSHSRQKKRTSHLMETWWNIRSSSTSIRSIYFASKSRW